MDTQPTLHHSFVLRVWRSDVRQPWRASLHIVASDHQMHFADMASAFAFLVRHVESADESPDRCEREDASLK